MTQAAKIKPLKYYPPLEEKINIFSHTIGIVLSVIGLFFLIVHAVVDGNQWHIVSFTIFGVSMILLFTASTCYHSSKKDSVRAKLRVLDHAAIYLLIAGSYTPFALVTLHGRLGWWIFGLVWAMAGIGITLKLFFTGRYSLISTLMYVLMGWMIVFFIKPLIDSLSDGGLFWLVSGGIAYTLGAVLYAIKGLKFNHAIFHIMVLLGAASHFISVYFYVL